MIFNVSGGGGTALNFRVVGGTAAPASPAENCIWVNTDTEITSWIFSNEEPSPAEAGMVWFFVVTSSTAAFNALKKNCVMVYPLSAKQYVDGAWKSVTAESYQGGEWVDWLVPLYWSGEEFTDITGGWVLKNKSSTSTKNGSLTKNATNMYIKTVASSSASAVTSSQVDLTPFNELHCICSCAGKVSVNVAESFPASSTVAAASATGITEEEIVLDISSVSGSMEICICDTGTNGTYVYKVWLT